MRSTLLALLLSSCSPAYGGGGVVNAYVYAHVNQDLSGPEWTMRAHHGFVGLDVTSPIIGQAAYKTLKAAAIAQGQTQAGFDTVASNIGGGGGGTFGAWYGAQTTAFKAQAWRIWSYTGEV